VAAVWLKEALAGPAGERVVTPRHVLDVLR